MRIIPRLFTFISLSILLTSCEFKCTVGNNSEQADKKYKPVEKDGALIYNGIHLETNKVSVDKAYLVAKDDGIQIDEGNFVDIQKGVKLLILVKDGWDETGGRVMLAGEMKVVAENGQVVLDMPDIFAAFKEGITIEDSKILGLSVYFTEWEAKGPVSLKVTFRLWDKRSDAYIQGDYTFHTK